MNERTYRQLRIVESRAHRVRVAIVIVIGIIASALFWLLMAWLVFANTGPHL